MDTTMLLEERKARVNTAIALGKPDRVPFVPLVENFYALGYGVTLYDAMTDLTNIIPAVEEHLRRYAPDLFFSPGYNPVGLLEMTDAQTVSWPTPQKPNSPYQYIETSFLRDEDWDDFMKDPTHFLLTRVMPERYGSFAGLAMMNVHGLASGTPLGLMGLALPPVAQALESMLAVSRFMGGVMGNMVAVAQRAVELGFPVWNNMVAPSPFDDFANMLRGVTPTLSDLRRRPEQLNEAVTRWGEITIPAAIQQAAANHVEYAFVPLTLGMDSMMSSKQYERYYWPHLKTLLEGFIDIGVTPLVLCEGGYNNRLDIITDIPAGKVAYFFEDVDFAKAKKALGKVACIGGGMDARSLLMGTKEDVIDETKRAIDILGPDGGFIMSNTMALDNVKHELMEAWYETTMTYGSYVNREKEPQIHTYAQPGK